LLHCLWEPSPRVAGRARTEQPPTPVRISDRWSARQSRRRWCLDCIRFRAAGCARSFALRRGGNRMSAHRALDGIEASAVGGVAL